MSGSSNEVGCHVFGFAPYAVPQEYGASKEGVRLLLSESPAVSTGNAAARAQTESGVEAEVSGGGLLVRIPPIRSDSRFRAVIGALGELCRNSEELRWTLDLSRVDDLPISFLTFVAALRDRLRDQGRTLRLIGLKGGGLRPGKRLDRLDLAHASDPEH